MSPFAKLFVEKRRIKDNSVLRPALLLWQGFFCGTNMFYLNHSIDLLGFENMNGFVIIINYFVNTVNRKLFTMF